MTPQAFGFCRAYLCPMPSSHHTSLTTLPRSHALRYAALRLGRKYDDDDWRVRDWPVPNMRWLREICSGPTFALLFARAVHREIKKSLATPRKLTPSVIVYIIASATTAGRPVRNAVMQANEGH